MFCHPFSLTSCGSFFQLLGLSWRSDNRMHAAMPLKKGITKAANKGSPKRRDSDSTARVAHRAQETHQPSTDRAAPSVAAVPAGLGVDGGALAVRSRQVDLGTDGSESTGAAAAGLGGGPKSQQHGQERNADRFESGELNGMRFEEVLAEYYASAAGSAQTWLQTVEDMPEELAVEQQAEYGSDSDAADEHAREEMNRAARRRLRRVYAGSQVWDRFSRFMEVGVSKATCGD